jgi:hypothetical protein
MKNLCIEINFECLFERRKRVIHLERRELKWRNLVQMSLHHVSVTSFRELVHVRRDALTPFRNLGYILKVV